MKNNGNSFFDTIVIIIKKLLKSAVSLLDDFISWVEGMFNKENKNNTTNFQSTYYENIRKRLVVIEESLEQEKESSRNFNAIIKKQVQRINDLETENRELSDRIGQLEIRLNEQLFTSRQEEIKRPKQDVSETRSPVSYSNAKTLKYAELSADGEYLINVSDGPAIRSSFIELDPISGQFVITDDDQCNEYALRNIDYALGKCDILSRVLNPKRIIVEEPGFAEKQFGSKNWLVIKKMKITLI